MRGRSRWNLRQSLGLPPIRCSIICAGPPRSGQGQLSRCHVRGRFTWRRCEIRGKVERREYDGSRKRWAGRDLSRQQVLRERMRVGSCMCTEQKVRGAMFKGLIWRWCLLSLTSCKNSRIVKFFFGDGILNSCRFGCLADNYRSVLTWR